MNVPSTAARRSGLSLVEVLVAMLILTIGATSLLALFASASSTHKRAVDRTHAALVAEQILSMVQSRYKADVDLGDLTRALQDELPTKIDGYFWDVAVYRPGEGSAAEKDADDEEGATTRWMEDELIVRVAVKSSEAAESREEVYTTILLPRGVAHGK